MWRHHDGIRLIFSALCGVGELLLCVAQSCQLRKEFGRSYALSSLSFPRDCMSACLLTCSMSKSWLRYTKPHKRYKKERKKQKLTWSPLRDRSSNSKLVSKQKNQARSMNEPAEPDGAAVLVCSTVLTDRPAAIRYALGNHHTYEFIEGSVPTSIAPGA